MDVQCFVSDTMIVVHLRLSIAGPICRLHSAHEPPIANTFKVILRNLICLKYDTMAYISGTPCPQFPHRTSRCAPRRAVLALTIIVAECGISVRESTRLSKETWPNKSSRGCDRFKANLFRMLVLRDAVDIQNLRSNFLALRFLNISEW